MHEQGNGSYAEDFWSAFLSLLLFWGASSRTSSPSSPSFSSSRVTAERFNSTVDDEGLRAKSPSKPEAFHEANFSLAAAISASISD